jgi:hypothetical protein
MNDKSKLTLSAEELQLVTDTSWILTKHKIMDKANRLLGNLAMVMKEKILEDKNYLPAAVIASTPKIAKGENYRQLPYLMLDYPRCFDKQNVFALRTMFWWGNFFSCTLHLSGNYKTLFLQALQNNTGALQKNNLCICHNKDEWQHHFENDNYMPANLLTEEEIKKILVQRHFIKVAAKFPLHQWDDAPVLLEKSFTEMMALLRLPTG